MTDFLFQVVLSNVFLSLALAIVAMAVGATTRRPHLAHLLWLLVLIKLMTPPVVTIPVVTIPGQSDRTVVSMEDHSQPKLPLIENSAETWLAVLDHGKRDLSLIWLLGSVFVFGWSLIRVYRFNRLLRLESEVAPQALQTVAARIANRLGLKIVPRIYTTTAHLSPMVWWVGGKVRVVIPAALFDQMDTRQFQWILAHELAHVRRRDYLVRWIEWLACVCFWWNPVVWWARYNLRANEELCCDALVVSSLKLKPKTYADSLLKAIECLACPVNRPPAMASEINSGGFLGRRFKMIVSDSPNQSYSRWLQACVLMCALVVLPLGFGCQKDVAVTDSAELTEEANLMKIGGQRDAERERGEGERDAGIEDHFNRIGVSDETVARIRNHLKENGITDNQIEQVLGGMLRVVHEMKSEGEEFELDPRLRDYFGEIGLTDEQIELVQGIARRILHSLKERGEGQREAASDLDDIGRRIRAAVERGELTPEEGRERMAAARQRQQEGREGDGDRLRGRFNRIGVTDEMVARIRVALKESGVTDEQIEPALGGMLRVVYEMKSEGEEFELDPRLQDYFQNRIGLTDEQIELVLGIARRIAHGLKDSNRERGANEDNRDEWIQKALKDGGLTDEQIKQTLGGLRKVIHEMKSEGEDFELDPRLRDYFGEIGLTDEQIELVQGIARRIVHGLKERGEGQRDAKKGAYEKVITKPLVKTDDCKYIVEGTIEYLKDGKTVAVVDYGNGECDNIATKTVDGKTYEFELDKKEKE